MFIAWCLNEHRDSFAICIWGPEFTNKAIWGHHGAENMDRMNCDRISNVVTKYQLNGKENVGRPLKRWKEYVLK
jgi:hypothetical protein